MPNPRSSWKDDKAQAAVRDGNCLIAVRREAGLLADA
jgi:hypothetical protein